MMSAAATDIIVKIIDEIIDNIDKTVDANKNNTKMESVYDRISVRHVLMGSLHPASCGLT